MIARAELQEYLDEIRQEVCSYCVERPAGGPPCGPLGKPCGVEMHLPQLIHAVRQVNSVLIAPYLDTNRAEICENCPLLGHSDFCPCPMDRLAVLVVQAIETVEQRRGRQEPVALPDQGGPGIEEITRAYEEATGKWTGCDWPTWVGCHWPGVSERGGQNLEGWTAVQARTRASNLSGEVKEAWEAAARWLAEVERRARLAQTEAGLAVAAARRGAWTEAAEHARRAWALEFGSGRPFRCQPATWQRLYELIKAASHGHMDRQVARGEKFALETI